MDVVIRHIAQAIGGPDVGAYIAYVAVALSILAVIVKMTPTKKDDEILEKVQQLYKQVQSALKNVEEPKPTEETVRSY